MKIKIIVVGKTKEPYLLQGEKQFQQRLSHFVQLDWIIVKEEKILSTRSEEEAKHKEAKRILNKITSGSYIVVLDQSGEQISSEMFAEFLQHKMDHGWGDMTFIIGGAFGLTDDVLNCATKILSLSKMTFTHDMSRLILLEQLYRAFTILRGTKYHK